MSTMDDTNVRQFGRVVSKQYQHVQMISSSMGELSCQDALKEMSKTEEDNHKLSVPKVKNSKVRLMYKHQYIDEQGGAIFIKAAQVSLHIPPGALNKRTFISIEVKSGQNCDVSGLDSSTSLTPIVSCQPDGLTFQKKVELILPHCAEFDNIDLHKATARFVRGHVNVSTDSTNEQDQVSCVLKERYCHVYTTHFSDVVVGISDCLKKRMLVVPFSRGSKKLYVKVWIINDLPSEYTILLHEEKQLNFIPFSHTGKFIFENHGQCSLKVQSSLEDRKLEEVSKDIDIQLLFRNIRSEHDFDMGMTASDASPKFVTVSLLKEPVFYLKKEIQGGDAGKSMQEEICASDEVETQHGEVAQTQTESDAFWDHRNPFPDLYKEVMIDENGGCIILEEAEVELHIPRGALTKPQLISVEVKAGNDGLSRNENPSTSVTPIVTCATDGEKFKAPVTLKMPHCAMLNGSALHEFRATYFIQDTEKGKDTEGIPCRLGELHCQISSTNMSNVEVTLQNVTKKKMRFVPFAHRDNDVLVIRMWLINDLNSEHTLLLQQQKKLGFVMLGYGRFEMRLSGEFMLTFQLVDSKNEEKTETKEIKTEMLFLRSRSCYSYQFQKKNYVSPREMYIKIFEKRNGGNAYHFRKTFDRTLLLALQGGQGEIDDETATIADALLYCEELSTALLTWRFSNLQERLLFPSETITSLKKVADEIEKRKNIKSSAVISGSSAGIVGGVLAITGAALIPITFGASIGLIAAGTALGVAGSGVSIGFSIDKAVKDARSKDEIKVKLEEFQHFQREFMRALSNVILIKRTIKILQRSLSFTKTRVAIDDVKPVTNIKGLIKLHDFPNSRAPSTSVPAILSQIIHQSEQVIQILSITEKQLKLDLIGKREISLDCMLRYRDVMNVLGLTYESEKNFLGFAIDYLKLDAIPAEDIILPAALSVESGSNIVVRGGATASRVAARVTTTVADVGDDIVRLSSGAAKIAKGFATASFVLGGMGIVADATFLGHAIYELVKKAPLSEGLIAVCDLMEKINSWQNLQSS